MAILTGTLQQDEIRGTRNADQVLALSGDDIVYGGSGADLIDGGDGNDTLYANAAGIYRDGALDTVFGGAGDDRVYGGLGDLLDGGIGFDRLTLDLGDSDRGLAIDFRPMTIGVDIGLGGLTRIDLPLGEARIGNFEAVERLIGTDFSDVLTLGNAGHVGSRVDAGAGNDIVRTSSGEDVVFGGIGNDVLLAGNRADRLDGGDGNDSLLGGRGADTLTGGAGADRFIFREGETGAGRLSADLITDFSHAQGDKIDLSRIDAIAATDDVDDRFTFIGGDRFSGTAGELRAIQQGGDTFVIGDTDGDARPDLLIHLTGQIDLTASDFRL